MKRYSFKSPNVTGLLCSEQKPSLGEGVQTLTQTLKTSDLQIGVNSSEEQTPDVSKSLISDGSHASLPYV